MKKILMVLAIVLAVIISVGAVSADDGWSFNFSSSSDSDGGQLDVSNNDVDIQGFKFVIPDGYKHNETADSIGGDAGEGFPNCKQTNVRFDNGDDSIIIKVVYGDITFDNETYEPGNATVAKQIEKQDGFFEEYNDGVGFVFCKDGKLVDIFAPNEETLVTVLQSAK